MTFKICSAYLMINQIFFTPKILHKKMTMKTSMTLWITPTPHAIADARDFSGNSSAGISNSPQREPPALQGQTACGCALSNGWR